MAKQQIVLGLMACCLLVVSLLLGGVSSAIDNQHNANALANTDQEQRQQQQPERLAMPSSTAAAIWTEIMTDELTHGSELKRPPPMAMGWRLTKRAPNGFIGMRGKKEMNAVDDSPPWLWANSVPMPLLAAHAMPPSAASIRFKKSPSAFYGVRGKKYGAGSELTRFNNMLLQLEQEQLREQLLQEFIDRVASSAVQDNEIVSSAKRAPIGFTGVRGKRPSGASGDEGVFNALNSISGENNGDDNDDGNNEDGGNVDDNDDDVDVDGDNGGDGGDASDLLLLNKRGPSNAFLGVRGKKSVDERVHYNSKRSPDEVFGGGAGSGSSSGLRSGGKQQRFVDFGNKFVAVRGKKDANSNRGSIRGALTGWQRLGNGGVGAGAGYSYGSSPLDMQTAQQLWRGVYDAPPWYGVLPAAAMASLGASSASSAESRYSDAVKRTPSGFVGMRGKRAAAGAPDADAEANAAVVAATLERRAAAAAYANSANTKDATASIQQTPLSRSQLTNKNM